MLKRVSLTKSQRSSGIGAELLALCQSVTDDGYLSTDEVRELRHWLKRNRKADLPAIDFLLETIERIIADQRITREERQELYRAIELVLPPAARREAVDARREAESELEHRERLARERERAAVAASEKQRPARIEPRSAARNETRTETRPAARPQRGSTARHEPAPHIEPAALAKSPKRDASSKAIATSKFMVANVHHQGRAEIVDRFADEGDVVYLARDPLSKVSSRAIEVRLENGFVIGLVPDEDAEVIAPLLDEGCPHTAQIKSIITGGRVPVPVVVSNVYEVDAEVKGAVYPADVPQRVEPTRNLGAAWQTQVGWALLLALLGCLGAFAYFVMR